MSATIAVETIPLRPRRNIAAGFFRRFHAGENLLISFALAAMVVLPLAEIVLRRTLNTGISGATSFLQHLTLVVAMLGGALAARENRLLSVSTLGNLLKGRLKSAAFIFSGACSAAVSLFLCVASWQFVRAEKEAGTILAHGIRTWTFEALLPLGFAAVTLRLLWHASETWTGRAAAAALAAALMLACALAPISPEHLVIPALSILAVAVLLGAPAFVALGGAAVILFWGAEQPIASIPISQYSLVTNPSLPTLPLFTLVGYFLAEGGAPKRLVRVFQALFGQFRGGAAVVTVLVCAFFTSFTGASGVTILALGGLLMPVLREAGYSEKNALGLVTGAGSLGLLFPPCLPLILYAIIAKIPIEQIFLAGIVPGILMVVLTGGWGVLAARRDDAPPQRFNWREACQATWEAKWELLLPLVALVALFGGFATPVEAAALTALYAFFAETVIYRDLKLVKDVPRVMTECGLLVGGVLLILGVALGFTNYLVDAEVVTHIVEWSTRTIHSPFVFLLALNAFLLVVGCLMDIYSAIVVQVPLIVPIGLAFGIDPLLLGIVFLANMELGYLTPPVGLNLFLSSYRFGKPVPEVMRSVVPIVIVLAVAVLLITYVPALTTTLPQWLGH